jgi:hypothetical protein
VFVQFTQLDQKSETEMVFLFLRYRGLRHNWGMRNSFMFDGVCIYTEAETSIDVTVLFTKARSKFPPEGSLSCILAI